jgi:hypothetical protein
VGLTLRFKSIVGVGRELAVGLGYKLVAAPVLILILYVWVLGQTDTATKVTIFEAGMGPMISGGIIAMTYGARPNLAATMLGIGVPLSILTRPLWYWLLTFI